MKKYNITVLGETIPIVSDEGDEYIEALTGQIQSLLMHLTRKGAPGLGPAAKLLFVSIMLADEVYKNSGELERIRNEQERAEGDLDNAKMVLDNTKSELESIKKERDSFKQELDITKLELVRARHELEEFLSEFDADKPKNGKQKNDINKET